MAVRGILVGLVAMLGVDWSSMDRVTEAKGWTQFWQQVAPAAVDAATDPCAQVEWSGPDAPCSASGSQPLADLDTIFREVMNEVAADMAEPAADSSPAAPEVIEEKAVASAEPEPAAEPAKPAKPADAVVAAEAPIATEPAPAGEGEVPSVPEAPVVAEVVTSPAVVETPAPSAPVATETPVAPTALEDVAPVAAEAPTVVEPAPAAAATIEEQPATVDNASEVVASNDEPLPPDAGEVDSGLITDPTLAGETAFVVETWSVTTGADPAPSVANEVAATQPVVDASQPDSLVATVVPDAPAAVELAGPPLDEARRQQFGEAVRQTGKAMVAWLALMSEGTTRR